MTTLDDIVHLPMKYKRHRYFIGRVFTSIDADGSAMCYLSWTNSRRIQFLADDYGNAEVYTYKEALEQCTKLAKASGVTHYICEVATAYHYPDVKYGRGPIPVTAKGVKKI